MFSALWRPKKKEKIVCFVVDNLYTFCSVYKGILGSYDEKDFDSVSVCFL